jgi:hypothetical protein
MRHASMVFGAAVSCLAGVVANGPTKAAVFDFSFGPGVSGTFTTGSASPTDPGYDLITGLTFDLLSGANFVGESFSFSDLVGSGFQSGSAFNPTTGAFINHGYVHDIGDFTASGSGQTITIFALSFSQKAPYLSGLLKTDDPFVVDTPLIVRKPTVGTPGPRPATPIPEPSTWAIMLLGFAGLALAGYRRTRAGERVWRALTTSP